MKAKNPTHIGKCLPRMSWSPANLYNLHQRTYGPPVAQTNFTKTSLTLFQQKWIAKRLVRAYHGDWIPEGTFKKAYLPDSLGPGATSMMFVEIEKRLDTVVFRACLADSVYKARMMVVHGKVKLNGKRHTDPNTRLQPGDLISVDPSSVTTLQPPKPFEAAAKAFKEPSAPSTPSPSDPDTPDDPSPEPSVATTAPAARAASKKPLPFHLPEFASPFLFIPPYLEISFPTCSIIYLRHPEPTKDGKSEIPSPYEADGEVMKLAWEYYAKMGRKGDERPKSMIGKRLGA